MSRPRGSRNKKTVAAIALELNTMEPMAARDILRMIRSNELWLKAVEFATAQRDTQAIVRILSYLTDHAYGSAPKSIQIDVDVRHHKPEDLARAREIAREIIDFTTQLHHNDDNGDKVEQVHLLNE